MKKARTLQDIKDHPAVSVVDREGNGYWIYLKDGWYNSQLEGLLIHEPTVKACCEILNQYVTESTESTESTEDVTEITTEATTEAMIEIVSFIREHRNGFCGREVIPADQCNPEEFKFFCDLAKSGNHAPLDNGETIWEVRIYSVHPDEIF